MSIMSLTAVELGKKIKSGEIGVAEAAKAALEETRRLEDQINSYVTVLDEKNILARADEVQKQIDSGALDSPLAGVPTAIKDNMCTKGILTTCSSKILGNFVPSYSAEAVRNLEKAGAVIIGKTNMDEFAMGSTTETSAYGITRNPTIQSTFREGLLEVPVRQWRPVNVLMHWAPILAVPSANPAHFAG